IGKNIDRNKQVLYSKWPCYGSDKDLLEKTHMFHEGSPVSFDFPKNCWYLKLPLGFPVSFDFPKNCWFSSFFRLPKKLLVLQFLSTSQKIAVTDASVLFSHRSHGRQTQHDGNHKLRQNKTEEDANPREEPFTNQGSYRAGEKRIIDLKADINKFKTEEISKRHLK
ncbi:hypothetical protein QTP86_029018, partial [Hemibagrus guttatus]